MRHHATSPGAWCRGARAWPRALLAMAVLLRATPAMSQTPPPTEAVAATPQLDEAKSLFRRGNELRRAGDYQQALALYLRSRELVPSLQNTTNAAICLERLGRLDEALDLYQEVLGAFAAEIGEDMRSSIASAMTALRRQVGSVDVAANVDGAVIIDGRMRGKLPLVGPLRVLPGTRRVLVLREGYESFERTVRVRVGETVIVDAHLRPLGAAGRLRIEEPRLTGADVFVDGALLGKVPWEGTLSAGPHVVFIRQGDAGTAPRMLTVVQGQTARVSLSAQRLGAEMQILVEPRSAEIFVDGVRVGQGVWRGALPLGVSAVEARAEGYRPLVTYAVSRPDRATNLDVSLGADRSHPRWRALAVNTVFVEGFSGLALSSSLGSGPEDVCDAPEWATRDDCEARDPVLGVMAGVRIGYELSNGLSFDATGGYLAAQTNIPTTIPWSSVEYRLDHHLRVRGPFVLAGLGYRGRIGRWLSLVGHLGAGVMAAMATDEVSGFATANGERRAVDVTTTVEEGNVARSAALLLVPRFGAELKFGRAHLGAGLMWVFAPIEGADLVFGEQQIRARGPCPGGAPQSLDCAPNIPASFTPRAPGGFVLTIPYLSARIDL